MIEVICLPSGDRAEAETPAGALLAAQTLASDADNAYGSLRRMTLMFLVNGELIRQVRGVDLSRVTS